MMYKCFAKRVANKIQQAKVSDNYKGEVGGAASLENLQPSQQECLTPLDTDCIHNKEGYLRTNLLSKINTPVSAFDRTLVFCINIAGGSLLSTDKGPV